LSACDDAQIPFLIGADFDSRRNVAWRVELGEPDPNNPLIEGDSGWDDGGPCQHGTVLRDPIDGKWKAWGTAVPNGTFDRRLVYYESDDGVDWRRPELDIHPFGGHKRTNILLDFDSGGTLIYANVLVRPDAPEDRRYEMYVLRRPEEPDEDQRIRPVAGFEGPGGKGALDRGIYRYVSPDGIRWRPDVGPVLVNDADALRPDGTADGIFIYRQPDGTYVAYTKVIISGIPGGLIPFELGAGGCRVLMRRTSADGVEWNRYEPCLLPDWRDPPDTQFMEISVTEVAGGYVGVLTVYRTSIQTLELQLAGSRDGRYWWRPDRRACVPQPALGDYGGGMMWGTHHMIGEGDSLHYYYAGLEGIHGDMLSTEAAEIARSKGIPHREMRPLNGETLSRAPSEIFQHGALCRATWRRGRLWALVTASGGNDEGSATASQSIARGAKVLINARTVKDGKILAEILDPSGQVISGFGRDDCEGFSGDATRYRLKWRGGDECPADDCCVRFILRRSMLYGFEFAVN
jgi:hypothetical protein